jgi:hypothetical protein
MSTIKVTNLKHESSSSDNISLDSSGRVGVGTATPGSTLDVAGVVTTSKGYTFNAASSASDTYLGTFAPGGSAMAFATLGTERARIDSSGNFKFNSGYGSVATAYGCRAWVNFNGTGTVAIRASGNVSSITDNGTGNYTVNFTTAMPDVNYCAVTDCGALTSGGTMAGNIATGSFRMLTMNGSFANEDRSIVFASVFR